jgi:DMSO reductase family type II enzyme heme b subunit
VTRRDRLRELLGDLDPTTVRDGIADRFAVSTPQIDRNAAIRASLISLITVIVLLTGYTALTAAVTSGAQPMAAVDEVPIEPGADSWSEASSRTVSLSEQQMAVPYGGGSVDEVTVQALSNDSHVAFRLTWTDPTMDASLSSPRNYSDAAAIMLKGGDAPPITMGATGTPVDIWYWRASWQFGGEKTAPWSGDMYAYPHPDEETRPGLAAGNPLSQESYDDYGQNYYAKGYGSLSHAPSQEMRATAERNGDEWSVVFVRERNASRQYDAAFDEHDTMYLAFAVWNGSADEVNGQKSITLQFSTLDTKSGELGEAEVGGGDDGDSSSEGGGGSDSANGDGPMTELLFDYVTPLLAAVIVSWLVAYHRIRS